MSYTLVVMARESDLTDEELDELEDLRDLTLFRKGRTPSELRCALDFWTAHGFNAHIYRTLDGDI